MQSSGSKKAEEKEEAAHMDHWQEYKTFVVMVLASKPFDAVIGLVILVNAMSIGVEQQLALEERSTMGIRIMENCFLVIYIVELLMRFVGHSWSILHDRWVRLDITIVLLGILNSWILEPIMNEAPNEMSPLMLLRALRLLRLVKTARLLAKIYEFQILVRGLCSCLTVMLYTMLVTFAVLYCFSVLAIELITKHSMNTGDNPDTEFQLHVEAYFSSVSGTMLTLVQFVTLDQLSEVYRPLCEKDPWLSLYFLLLLMIVSIILTNLVTAVIFSSTLDANQKAIDDVQSTQERDWGSFISNLKNMFNRIDEDMSGKLTLEEFLAIDKRDQVALCQAMDVPGLTDIFMMLDTERRGEVSINDFFDCILDKVLTCSDANLKRMERQVETMHWRLKETFAGQIEMSQRIALVQERLEQSLNLGKVVGTKNAECKCGSIFMPDALFCRKCGASRGGEERPNAMSKKKITGIRAPCKGGVRDSPTLQTSAGGQGDELPYVKATLPKPVLPPSTMGSPTCLEDELGSWEMEISRKLHGLLAPILEDGIHSAVRSFQKSPTSARSGPTLLNDRSPRESSDGVDSRGSLSPPPRGGTSTLGVDKEPASSKAAAKAVKAQSAPREPQAMKVARDPKDVSPVGLRSPKCPQALPPTVAAASKAGPSQQQLPQPI